MGLESHLAARADGHHGRVVDAQRIARAKPEPPVGAIQALAEDGEEVVDVERIEGLQRLARDRQREARRVRHHETVALPNAEQDTLLIGARIEPHAVRGGGGAGAAQHRGAREIERCERAVPGALDESACMDLHLGAVEHGHGFGARRHARAPRERGQRRHVHRP
jgi:hypothetical protein